MSWQEMLLENLRSEVEVHATQLREVGHWGASDALRGLLARIEKLEDGE